MKIGRESSMRKQRRKCQEKIMKKSNKQVEIENSKKKYNKNREIRNDIYVGVFPICYLLVEK